MLAKASMLVINSARLMMTKFVLRVILSPCGSGRAVRRRPILNSAACRMGGRRQTRMCQANETNSGLEAASAGGRGAGGAKFSGGVGQRVELHSGLARRDGLQEEGSRSRLRMSPLGSGHGAATIVVAATGVADYKLFGFRGLRIRAVTNSLAEAARTRRGRRGRERHGD